MAMQKVDRAQAKHAMATNKRVVPTLVNRTNKRTFAELSPLHVLISRFNYGWGVHERRRCDKSPWCSCRKCW